jgi:hypothetical protein
LSGLDFPYSVFGLSLRSNCPIPALEPAKSASQITDLEIRFNQAPGFHGGDDRSANLIFASSALLDSGQPTLRIWEVMDGAFLRLDYFDGMQFWLRRDTKQLWVHWSEGSSLEDAFTYLLGPVLGLLLRLRGITCLHASAVTLGDRVAAFAGSEGAGKSTTAAALAQRGHSVISDDIVALVERDGAFFVLPAHLPLA